MDLEPFDAARDTDAVTRVWEECGWLGDDGARAAMAHLLDASSAWVGLIDGQAECAVTTVPGSLRHGDAEVPLAVVSSVTTSHIGRRQGLAQRLTARALQAAADAGAAVSVLGMFEQGFYDRIGFGSGAYSSRLTFDPATLRTVVPYRRPVRLGQDDWEAIHDCLGAREASHGRVRVDAPGFTRAQMAFTSSPFGLGYRDPDGRLTHFVWGEATGEQGPYKVTIMAARDGHDLLELLNLLASLGDQVRSVTIEEPPGIQLQDLIIHVGRQHVATAGAAHAFAHTSGTWWQARMLDVAACTAAVRVASDPVRFIADVTDPVTTALQGDGGWRGVTGRYEIELATESSARLLPGDPAADDAGLRALPRLEVSVNALTRLWLGVRSATALSLTDDLRGDPELLRALDVALAALPSPNPTLDF